jgi:organic hydroperoxide reductase OsmC/OhrA
MPAVHHFDAHLLWEHGREGVAAFNHRVELAGREALEVSGAPQYKGDGSRLNPEELFLASLASCQLLTYVALASRAGIPVTRYEDSPRATLTIADKRMRVTEVVLRPKITLGAGADAAKARALVDTAHDGCFIANSVACTVTIEPELVTAS